MAGFALSLLRKAVASAPPPQPKPPSAPPPEPATPVPAASGWSVPAQTPVAAATRPYDPSAPVLSVEFLCSVTGREFVRDYQKTPDGHAYIGQRPSLAFGELGTLSTAASGWGRHEDAELTARQADLLPYGAMCLHCSAAMWPIPCPRCGMLRCHGRSDRQVNRCSAACGYVHENQPYEPKIRLKRTCSAEPRGDSLTFESGPGFLLAGDR